METPSSTSGSTLGLVGRVSVLVDAEIEIPKLEASRDILRVLARLGVFGYASTANHNALRE